MSLAMGEVTWDQTPDRVAPAVRRYSVYHRPGQADAALWMDQAIYQPQQLRVTAAVADSAAADAKITAADNQEGTATTWTDQHGDTHSVYVTDFQGTKAARIDGQYLVSGTYTIIKYG